MLGELLVKVMVEMMVGMLSVQGCWAQGGWRGPVWATSHERDVLKTQGDVTSCAVQRQGVSEGLIIQG